MIDKRILALGLVLASIATASYLYGARQRTQQQRHAAGQSKLEMVQKAKEITAELNGADSADAAAQALPTGPQLTNFKTVILNIPNPAHRAAYTNLETAVKTALPKLTDAIAGVTNKTALKKKAKGLQKTGITDITEAAQNLVTAINAALGGGGGDGDGDGGDVDPDAAAKATVTTIIGKSTDTATKDTIWGRRTKAQAEKTKIDALITNIKTVPGKEAALAAAITEATNQHDSFDEGFTVANMTDRIAALGAADVTAAEDLRTTCTNMATTLLNKYNVLKAASDAYAPGKTEAEKKNDMIGTDGTKKTIRGEWNLVLVKVNDLATKVIPDGKKATAAFNALKEGEARYNDLNTRQNKTDAALKAMSLDELTALRDEIVAYKNDLKAANASDGVPYFEKADEDGDAITLDGTTEGALEALQAKSATLAGFEHQVFKVPDSQKGKEINNVVIGNIKVSPSGDAKTAFTNAVKAANPGANAIAISNAKKTIKNELKANIEAAINGLDAKYNGIKAELINQAKASIDLL